MLESFVEIDSQNVMCFHRKLENYVQLWQTEVQKVQISKHGMQS